MKTISQGLVNRLENYGYNVVTDYSGRCMYGKTCVGIEARTNNLNCIKNELSEIHAEVIEEINIIRSEDNDTNGTEDLDEEADILDFLIECETLKIDSLGLNYIIYCEKLVS